MAKDTQWFRLALGKALKRLRKSRRLTQEDFSVTSSRTYVSTLERGVKSPTLEKINQLCATLDCHPLTLLVMTYAQEHRGDSYKQVLRRVEKELDQLG
jgi:transcriptional regulator with XRE-family HTH domain